MWYLVYDMYHVHNHIRPQSVGPFVSYQNDPGLEYMKYKEQSRAVERINLEKREGRSI